MDNKESACGAPKPQQCTVSTSLNRYQATTRIDRDDSETKSRMPAPRPSEETVSKIA
jgi:hypothetical protein